MPPQTRSTRSGSPKHRVTQFLQHFMLCGGRCASIFRVISGCTFGTVSPALVTSLTREWTRVRPVIFNQTLSLTVPSFFPTSCLHRPERAANLCSSPCKSISCLFHTLISPGNGMISNSLSQILNGGGQAEVEQGRNYSSRREMDIWGGMEFIPIC